MIEREKAEMGVLVSLGHPTGPMRVEAASAGFIQTAHGSFPRIQLAPVSELFSGIKPRLPMAAPLDQLRPPKSVKAKKGSEEHQLQFVYSFHGGKQLGETGEVIHLDPRQKVSRM
ncbi:hypothetical protein NKI34_31755 [Mesorhizobium sp. M0700]|uniref:hypothetical protein n=1 Tax=Mesorhizobium sp. M0700 TaxID=2956988 RepID=UPI00333B8D89